MNERPEQLTAAAYKQGKRDVYDLAGQVARIDIVCKVLETCQLINEDKDIAELLILAKKKYDNLKSKASNVAKLEEIARDAAWDDDRHWR